MNARVYALFGIIGPVVAYLCIGISIVLSPWFSWHANALSDLGHAVTSDVASIYNFGLLLAGFFMLIYAITALRPQAKYTSGFLGVSAFTLQLVAAFDEVYRLLHVGVSTLFFVLIILTSIVYAVERKSYLATAAFITGLISWMTFGIGVYVAGVAVPETISSVAAVIWIMYSALKIYLRKQDP